LFADILGNNNDHVATDILMLFVKAGLILGLVYVGNKWLLPRLLHLIAMTKNQELFLISIFLICLAVALLTSQLGMSLAFGAFLAGLMISESDYSHNAFSNLIPFKDVFTSFFFVSIGMLLDLSFIIENWQLVLVAVLLVIVLKTIIAGATGFILGHTFRGTVMVGLALCQVGEFSFVLAKIGLGYSILSNFYYQLFLAVAVITMAITPFLIKLSVPLADALLKLPLPKFLVEGLFPLQEMEIPDLKNHLVIIGKDTSALKLSRMATLNNIRHVSIIFDPLLAKEKIKNGDHVVYGDAVNEPILQKAHVDQSDIVVISVGNLIPAMAITDKVRKISRNTWILVRAKHIEHVGDLYKVGADQVFPERLEIAIDLFNRILVQRLYPRKEVNRILSHIRTMNLGEFTDRDVIHQPSVLDEFPNLNINALKIDPGSRAAGKSLLEIQLRNKTGVTLLAIKRGTDIIEHPLPGTVFQTDDIAYVLGNPEQVNLASELFTRE
ncbi:MAG TPA: sodium:proton exchanger, partial [Bacteroides sp.]|nr:sodium:proton exchanger [Bacteroides sp.]